MDTKVATRRLGQIKQILSEAPTQDTNRTELNPISFLKRSALIFPNHPAVITEDENVISYRNFEKNVLQLALILRERYGIRKGDRVGILCRNVPVLLEAHFSVPILRAVIVAINTRLNSDEVSYIVKHSGCSVLIHEPDLSGLIEKVNVNEVRCISSDSSELNKKIENKVSWDLFTDEGSEDDVIAISYTSGTTGRPKGVMSTYRGATLACLNNVLEMNLNKESRYLWTLPLFHCNGWCFPWSVAAASGTSVLISRVEPDQIWKHFLNSKITHYCAAPTVQIAISHFDKATPLPQRITAMTAGSPPSSALIENLEKLNIIPIHTYGLTETYGPCTINYRENEGSKEDRLRRMARQGHAYLLADPVRVVDSKMRDVPADGKSVGEVVLRGNMVMKGYHDDPSSTAKAFNGGWFHSGDLAVMDPDGCIILVDRSKDIIISGGENISTVEIEKTLAHHPLIREVAVVSSPHPKWGETPKAFIVLKDSNNVHKDLEKDMLEFSRKHLAHFKCPSKFAFVEELPKTGTGKVQKYILKSQEWKDHKQTIG